MEEDSSNSPTDRFPISRRSLLRVPLGGLIGYGALGATAGSAQAAQGPTTIASFELPTFADSIEIHASVTGLIGDQHTSPVARLTAGDVEVFEVSCDPPLGSSGGCGASIEEPTPVSADISQYAGEHVEVQTYVSHSGHLDVTNLSVEINGTQYGIDEIPTLEIVGSPVAFVGKPVPLRGSTPPFSVEDWIWAVPPEAADDDGTILGKEIDVVFTEPGTYQIELSAHSPNYPGAARTTREIEVIESPGPTMAGAVELDESPTFEYAFDTSAADADVGAIDVESETALRFRDSTVALGVSADQDVKDAATGPGQRHFLKLPSPNEAAVTFGLGKRRYGLEYDTTVTASADGHTLFEESLQTFAFDEVVPFDVVPVTTPDFEDAVDESGSMLFETLRTRAQRTNAFFASGLGNMGATGRRFRFVTEHLDGGDSYANVSDGWLVLPFQSSEYANTSTDVEIGEQYTPTLKDFPSVDGDDLSDSWAERWRYLAHTTQLALLSSVIDHETSSDDETELLVAVAGDIKRGLTPFATDNSIDLGHLDDEEYADIPPYDGSTVCGVGGESWIHEIGHLMNLPDLYDEPNNPAPTELYNWGQMGGGDQFTAYCRASAFADRGPSDWLTGVPVPAEQDESSTVTLEPLSTSRYKSEYEYPAASVSEDLSASFVAEARRSEASGLTEPGDSSNWIQRSHADEDGIALYFAGFRSLDEQPHDGFAQYLYDETSGQSYPWNEPTLATVGDTHYHVGTWTHFEFAGGAVDDSADLAFEPRVSTDQVAQSTGRSDVDYTVTVAALLGAEFAEELWPPGDQSPRQDDPLPTPDILATTPDGRRAGTDPATGEVVDEIDGAYVAGQGSERTLLLPPLEDVEVTISGERLRAELLDRDLDFDAGDPIEIDQTTILDVDPSIEETDDGELVHHGRTFRETTTTIDGEGEAPLSTTSIGLDVDPDTLNTASASGRFVTAYLSIGSGLDPADLDLSTVELNGVPAVTDRQYGFVRNLPIDDETEPPTVMVKFDRAGVVDALDTGTQTLTVSGLVGSTTVVGTDEIDVVGPENGDDDGGQDDPGDTPGNDGGNGPPEDKPGRGPPEDKPGRGPPEENPGRGPPEEKPGRGPPEDKPGRGPPEEKPGRGPPGEKPGRGPPEDKPGRGSPEEKPGRGPPGNGK